MAPSSTRCAPLPDPQDTGNRVSKQKPTTKKLNTASKSSRLASKSLETRRKAEAIERALRIPQINEQEIPQVNDTQMDDPFDNTSLTTINAPRDSVVIVYRFEEKNKGPQRIWAQYDFKIIIFIVNR